MLWMKIFFSDIQKIYVYIKEHTCINSLHKDFDKQSHLTYEYMTYKINVNVKHG